ncbi:hypothetical protein BDV97DRAFT_347148 [Delphinella strobiligena]|nr:hypothetical protein BDV97DRAFT_347148 [Delphinella strobiligena]
MNLSLTTANTADHTKKVFTNARLFLGYCTGTSWFLLPQSKLSPIRLRYNLLDVTLQTSQSPRYDLGI